MALGIQTKFMVISNQENNPLVDLVAKLSVYDPVDLLSASAALQLMPENADRMIRLETLSHVAAAVPTRSSKLKIAPKHLAKACNTFPLGEGSLVHAEDPFDNPFTEELSFYGGSYICFPGTTEGSTSILRHLSKAIFLCKTPIPSSAFINNVGAFLLSVLALSNEIARRAGLSRGTFPVSAPGGRVVVPEAVRLSQLKQAVCYRKTELSRILSEAGGSLASLDILKLSLGDISIKDYDLGNPQLAVTPLVEVDDKIIAAIPSLLTVSARNHIVTLAHQFKITGELTARYTNALWDTITTLLDFSGHQLSGISTKPTDLPHLKDGFFFLDTDKALYVLLIADPLTEYGSNQPFGIWEDSTLSDEVAERTEWAENHIFSSNKGLNELLCLVLIGGVGRSIMISMDRESGPKTSKLLTLPMYDLETLLLLEGGNHLALWKFAQAADKVRIKSHIVTDSTLNEYFYFRKQNYSYYLSDDVRPND